MALTLNTANFAAHVSKTLTYHEDLPAGADLEMKVGDDELDEAVPAGKTWDVQLSLVITETDA